MTVKVPRLIVLYDADCGLCSRTAQALRILDGANRLQLVPLQRAAEVVGSDGPSERALRDRLHVRDGAGAWWSGGEATLRIAASVSLLRPLAVVGRLPLVALLVEPVYRLLARHRNRLGRLLGATSCRFGGDGPGDDDR